MKKYLLALAAGALAVPVYAQQGQDGNVRGQRATEAAQQFVKKAAVGDMYEIQSSEMALDKSQADQFRQFAQRIIDDHTKSSRELKTLAQDIAGLKIPTQLDAKHKAMMKKLQSASGSQFDKLYRSQQIDAHKAAVQLYDQYSQSGQNAKLRQFAKTTLPKLKQHLQMAQNLPQEPSRVGQVQKDNQQGQRTQQKAAVPGQQQDRQQVIASPSPDHMLGSQLRGTNVYGANGEDVGEVNDIVLSRDGQIVALVVGVGGFLGIGEKDVAIPFGALEVSEQRGGRAMQRADRDPAQTARQDNDRSSIQPQGQQQGQNQQATLVNPQRIVLRGMTREELEAAPSFNSGNQNR